MNDEAWLLDVVKRCGVHEARASALARAGAQMLRRLAIKCPPGVFGKGECCRRAVALELAAREAGGANLRREALLTACSSRPAAYDRVLRHAESALGARTMSSGGSAAVVDTIEQLARAVVADEASAAAVADAARGLQTMLRRGAHPDGAQRAACVAAAGQILDLDAQRLCAAAGCSSNDFATACRDLETARRRQRDESQLAFFDAPQGVAARGAGHGRFARKSKATDVYSHAPRPRPTRPAHAHVRICLGAAYAFRRVAVRRIDEIVNGRGATAAEQHSTGHGQHGESSGRQCSHSGTTTCGAVKRLRLQRLSGAITANNWRAATWSPAAQSRRSRTPSISAVTENSIFIASSTKSVWPAATRAPAVTSTR